MKAMKTTKKTAAKSKKTKYSYFKVIQGNYGYGWEDLVSYRTNSQGDFETTQERSEMKQNYKAYRENERSARHRVIFRKVKK